MFGVCQLTPNIKLQHENIYLKIKHGSFAWMNSTVFIGKERHSEGELGLKEYRTNDVI